MSKPVNRGGWFPFYGAMLDDEHFLPERPFRPLEAWLWLNKSAAYQSTIIPGPTTRGKLTLERGEFCFAVRYLASAWGWPKSNVHRELAYLEKWGRIERRERVGETVFAIVGYDLRNVEKWDTKRDADGTANGTPDPLESNEKLVERGTPNGTPSGTPSGTKIKQGTSTELAERSVRTSLSEQVDSPETEQAETQRAARLPSGSAPEIEELPPDDLTRSKNVDLETRNGVHEDCTAFMEKGDGHEPSERTRAVLAELGDKEGMFDCWAVLELGKWLKRNGDPAGAIIEAAMQARIDVIDAEWGSFFDE